MFFLTFDYLLFSFILWPPDIVDIFINELFYKEENIGSSKSYLLFWLFLAKSNLGHTNGLDCDI